MLKGQRIIDFLSNRSIIQADENKMRIIGFNKKWDKLTLPEFTTFRVPRRDTDWFVGEKVQVVYRPRSKDRKPLFLAEIVTKEPKTFKGVTEFEAIADGFANSMEMWNYLKKAHKDFTIETPLNKLTLKRIEFELTTK